MPRQNPNLLPSAADLLSAAGSIRAALSAGDFESLKKGLTSAADGFEQAGAAIATLERRLRDLGEANVDLSGRSAPMVVSGDRIRGGIPVQGILPNLVGQSLDLTFASQVAHVTSMDHGTGGYLELDLDGLGITLNSHGGTITLTGTPSFGTPVPIASGGTGQITAAAAFNALSPVTTLGDVIYGSAANVNSRLAGNTTSTKKFFRQTGTGAVSAVPAWDTVTATDAGLGNVPNVDATNATNISSGVLAIGVGGTGQTTALAAWNALLPASPWTALPTLQNGWTDFGAPFGTASYAKTGTGVVHLHGLLTAGTIADGTLITTLPAGFRPQFSIALPAAGVTAGGFQYVEILIQTSGAVSIFGAAGAITNLHVTLSFPSF